MRRGTTPLHTFTIPFDTSLLDCVKVVYAQDDKVILEKKNEGCVLDGNTVKVTLTQEDTFLFDCRKRIVQIQVRVLTLNNEALASEVLRVPVEKCLDNEVLV